MTNITSPNSPIVLSGLLQDAASRKTFRQAWRQHLADMKRLRSSGEPALSTATFALHALLLGDPRAAFSPVTNARKLANGQQPLGALLAALSQLRWFDEKEACVLRAAVPGAVAQRIALIGATASRSGLQAALALAKETS